jgi:hypothetical protein
MPSVFWEPERTDRPLITDINHNGVPDILLINGCTLYSYDANGQANPGWPLTNKAFQKLDVADLNNDGQTDLLVTSHMLLQAIRGDGTQIWQKTFATQLYNPAIGNVDTDAKPEIVVSDGGLWVLRLDGTTKWHQPFVSGSTKPHSTVYLADIDGDGKQDLVTQMGLTPKIYAYRLRSGKSLITGFPVTMPGTIQGMQAANITKSPRGNDLLVSTSAGLVAVRHTKPAILYTIKPGSDVTGLTLGTTTGTNFVALASFGGTQEVYQFNVNGAAVTKADQARR